MPGAVTIATNMAGRGTDIQLGGNFEIRKQLEISSQTSDDDKKVIDLKKDISAKKEIALKAGGLFVIGTKDTKVDELIIN